MAQLQKTERNMASKHALKSIFNGKVFNFYGLAVKA
jgi:hypothetical protein